MTIIDFYKDQVLPAFQLFADEEDMISFKEPGGANIPARIDGKRLYLPTRDRLKAGGIEGEDYIFFHPIGENLARKGPSPVLKTLQTTAKTLISFYVVTLANSIISAAADVDTQSQLPPECFEYLKDLTQVKASSVKALDDLMEKALAKNALVTVYLKSGGTLRGTKMNRMCTVRFPIMEALKSDEEEPYGVKLRKRDRKTFINLFEKLLPGGDDLNTYSGGSTERDAPYFEALLRGYGNAMGQINKCIELYGKPMELEIEEIDLGYLDHIDRIKEFKNKIPPQSGNEGTVDQAAPEEKPEKETRRSPAQRAAEIADRKISTRETPARSTRRSEAAAPPWDDTDDVVPVRRETRERTSAKKGLSLSEAMERVRSGGRRGYEDRDDRRGGLGRREERRGFGSDRRQGGSDRRGGRVGRFGRGRL
jgi:hypothetical protein